MDPERKTCVALETGGVPDEPKREEGQGVDGERTEHPATGNWQQRGRKKRKKERTVVLGGEEKDTRHVDA